MFVCLRYFFKVFQMYKCIEQLVLLGTHAVIHVVTALHAITMVSPLAYMQILLIPN